MQLNDYLLYKNKNSSDVYFDEKISILGELIWKIPLILSTFNGRLLNPLATSPFCQYGAIRILLVIIFHRNAKVDIEA